MTATLRLDSIECRFGSVIAASNVSFELDAGRIVGLIGPNGAGKTTLLNLISGFYTPRAGTISLRGENISKMKPDEIARRGIRRTFQHNRLFSGLTALENVIVGCHHKVRASASELHQHACDQLERVGLRDWAHRYPHELPYAYQRRVEIARALASAPSVLLLDEPAAGMHADERQRLIDIVRGVAASGVAVLIIEHDMALVGALCERVLVLNFGTLIAEGTFDEVRNVPEVRRAYLGRAA